MACGAEDLEAQVRYLSSVDGNGSPAVFISDLQSIQAASVGCEALADRSLRVVVALKLKRPMTVTSDQWHRSPSFIAPLPLLACSVLLQKSHVGTLLYGM